MSNQVFQAIYQLAEDYSFNLRSKINSRILEMADDNNIN